MTSRPGSRRILRNSHRPRAKSSRSCAASLPAQALPTAQVEAVVAFVAARHPPSVVTTEVAAPRAGAPSRKMQLNLGRCDALVLRQLQHLTATCTATHRGQLQGQAAQAAAGTQQQQQQPEQQGAAGGQGAAAAAAPSAQSQQGAGEVAGGAPGGAAGDAGTAPGAATQPGQQDGPGGAAGRQGPQQATEPPGQAAGGTEQQAPPSAAQGEGVPAAGPGTVPGTIRISDVVTNASAMGISQRAGVRWPGLAVGAGASTLAPSRVSLVPTVELLVSSLSTCHMHTLCSAAACMASSSVGHGPFPKHLS